ncbi:hypothetical protein KC207_06635 [Phycicoccus sp. BSK3Z-2]|uniref:Glycosyl transferase n=1 Tax=Phycicoccus avicenniae TaxID=2828860 RepID=A0A941D7L2_9MICO|nr:hypothetical protein [Phycicoccus avicenniae]MBR7742961.1 hypothetical protein [Phycicoccus avicenniae]
MTWSLLGALVVVTVLSAAAWWLGRQDERPEPARDAADPTLPLAPFGYRMAQVDDVVLRLRRRIAERDDEIARLRASDDQDRPARTLAPPPPMAVQVVADAEEPPPRPRPATGPALVAGRPPPWRRAELAVPLAHLLVALYVLQDLVTAVRTGHLSQGVQDQQAFEWYLGASAHNVLTLSNPLLSDLQNFPDGVNLMANAAVVGLGLPLTPLTVLAGPQVTFVVVELLGLSLTATAWYWLLRRRLPVHPAAAFAASLLAGFGPGMVSHANGHPNFVVQALVPVILDRLLRLVAGRRPVRDGVVLGLLVAWQVLVGEEVLLLAAVGFAVGGAVLLAHRGTCRRLRPRPAARGLGTGVLVALAVVAFPLWWQFFGPQSYTSLWHPPAGNDLAALWGRATRTVGADPWASAALSMNRTEENAFFGVPLWLAAGLVTVVLWRVVLVRALAAVVLVSCWLSLGEELTLHGTPLGIPGPGVLLEQVPVVENVLPTRFALVALPAFAALLALGVEAVRRAVDAWLGDEGPGVLVCVLAGAVALAPLVPTPLVVDPRDPVPAFFADGTWQEHVDDGAVLAAPPPNVADTRALEWQAEARWGFPVVAGYFVGPDGTPERGGRYGAAPTALSQWMLEIARDDVPATATEEQRRQFRADLRDGRVDAVVLPEGRPAEAALLASLTSAFGPPEAVGGVYVWDAQEVTGGAG